MSQNRKAHLAILFLVVLMKSGWAQSNELVPVVPKPVSRTIELPGEFLPFMSVSLHAKVESYVEHVLVDRGSIVKKGQLLIELSAPEISAHVAEAESKKQGADSERLQAEAQLAAAQSTYDRLKEAAKTPGAIAGNELIQAEKQRDAAKALVNSREEAAKASSDAIQAIRDLQSYLKIIAPFDGVVTERLVHPGALVGPGNDIVLLTVQQVSRLRLVVSVPEEDVSGIVSGASVPFRVPAWPGRTYLGKISRVSRALDPKTRTMAVELDVANNDGSLAPGMYPSVKWPIHRSQPALFLPKTSIVTTTERTFVIRDRNGTAEWIDVKKGMTEGDQVEVIGDLKPGDRVLRRASDEIRPGTALQKQR